MPNSDMETLLNEGMHIGVEFLEKNGEFFPFGVAMTSDGSVAHVAHQTRDEQPTSEELIDLIVSGFRSNADAGEYKSTGIISDVRVSMDDGTESDAICIAIEHCEDEPVTCLLPYSKTDDGFQYGELIAQHGDRHIFPHSTQ